MRMILLAMGICAAAASARADTFIYTAIVPPTDYDAYQGQSFTVLTPGFDTSLGTLQSVSIAVAGTVQDAIFSPSGDTVPFPALFNNLGSITGFGLNAAGVLSQDSGTATTLFANNGFSVNATVSTTQDLQDWAANAIVSTGFQFYSTVTDTDTNALIAYLSDNATFTGTVTETFAYTALPVPEPQSLGMFLAGLLGIGILAHRRRIRVHER